LSLAVQSDINMRYSQAGGFLTASGFLWMSALSHHVATPMMPSHRFAGARKMAEEDEWRLAPLSVRVPPSVKRELAQLAKADDRSLASYIERVLKQHIAAKKADSAKPTKRK
jgi:hypothetical protein